MAAGFVLFCALLAVAVFKGGGVTIANASAPAAPDEAPKGGEAQRARAAAVVRVLEGQVTLWKIQHDGRLPDFARYPNWEQFLQTTDRAGSVSAGSDKTIRARLGPYLGSAPVNPLNGLSNVAVLRGPEADGDVLPGGPAGFVIRLPGGDVLATDASGARILKAGRGIDRQRR